jgi:hypothetical protein
LWELKSSGIARAFIFCDKISRFLAFLAFWAFLYRGRYFFFNSFAISLQNSFFLLFFLYLVKRTIILVFFFQIFKASPYYRGEKLVELDLDLLEITQISPLFGYFFAKQLFSSFLPVNRTINLVVFFSQIFKGFTLVPWQKVGRI